MVPSVSIAHSDKNVWIKIKGRGNFQCSPCLKKIIQEKSVQGPHDYTIDLVECEQLDSTFMGTLTGISQRLKATNRGNLRVINVSDSNQQLMENLGLDQLFSIQPIFAGKEFPSPNTESSFSEVIDISETAKETVEETVRSAHEALVTANSDNAPKFQNLLEIIR